MADNTQGTNEVPFYAVPKFPACPAENLYITGNTGSITFSTSYAEQIGTLLGIKTGTTITIPFHLENDFGFSLGNKWESLVPDVASEFLSTFYNLLSMGDIIEGAQFRVVSRAMQTLAWKGSENPVFTVNCTFVCTQRNYNPAGIIKVLSACCLPLGRNEANPEDVKQLNETTSKTSAGINRFNDQLDKSNIPRPIVDATKKMSSMVSGIITNAGLIAPLGYRAKVDPADDSSEILQGGISLNISHWFRANNLVIKDISNISFSKEIIRSLPDWAKKPDSETSWGFPLYAKCTLTLTPNKPITFGDFIGYFTESSAVGGSSSLYGTMGERLGI